MSAAKSLRLQVIVIEQRPFVVVHASGSGTELPSSALQRFRPESEGQLTFGGRDHEDRS